MWKSFSHVVLWFQSMNTFGRFGGVGLKLTNNCRGLLAGRTFFLFKVFLESCYYSGKLKTTVCVVEEMMMMMMMTLGIHLTAAVEAVILASDTSASRSMLRQAPNLPSFAGAAVELTRA